MKAIERKDGTSESQAMMDLRRALATSARGYGKTTSLYPELTREKLNAAIDQLILKDKPYDMEDKDWLEHKGRFF